MKIGDTRSFRDVSSLSVEGVGHAKRVRLIDTVFAGDA